MASLQRCGTRSNSTMQRDGQSLTAAVIPAVPAPLDGEYPCQLGSVSSKETRCKASTWHEERFTESRRWSSGRLHCFGDDAVARQRHRGLGYRYRRGLAAAQSVCLGERSASRATSVHAIATACNVSEVNPRPARRIMDNDGQWTMILQERSHTSGSRLQ